MCESLASSSVALLTLHQKGIVIDSCVCMEAHSYPSTNEKALNEVPFYFMNVSKLFYS